MEGEVTNLADFARSVNEHSQFPPNLCLPQISYSRLKDDWLLPVPIVRFVNCGRMG